MFPNKMAEQYIEDITQLHGDTKFHFSCWKKISLVLCAHSRNIFPHSQRNFVSPSGHVHVMFYLLHKHQWNTKPFHLIVFWCERRDLLRSHSKGDIFTCEDNMLFSHVKISSFHAKAHLVFHWCLYNNLSF